jgi:RNA polymerase sigma-70 factor (ECF subfamily)
MPEEERTLGDREADAQERDPDGAALRRILAGEVQAFAEVVERHEGRLRRLVTGILADSHLAEDVVQDVFLIAYRKLPGYRFESRFGTWMARIAVRKAMAARRRRRSRGRRQVPLEEAEAGRRALRGSAPERRLQEEEGLRRTLGALTLHERTALVLLAEGYTYAEIGHLMGRPAGSVGTWIHRARQRLGSLPGSVDPSSADSRKKS